jgi:hypothetical protein
MKIVEAEKLVKSELGPRWAVVNVSGYWLLHGPCGSGWSCKSKSLTAAVAAAKAEVAAEQREAKAKVAK